MTKTQQIILAAGCFWCIQDLLDHTKGVLKTVVGYTGGHQKNPTYDEVCDGNSGHFEAIRVEYDPTIISLEKLIDLYLTGVDPENPDGQFCDIGSQYRLAIFYQTQEEKEKALQQLKHYQTVYHLKRLHVDLIEAKPFYPAEIGHQKFYEKNPERYNAYKKHSGRIERLKELERKKTIS